MRSIWTPWSRLRFAVMVAALIVLIFLPIPLSPFLRGIAVDVVLFALLAMGLNVVVGFAGLLDLGYVAFYAIGVYTFAIISAGDFSRALFLRQGQDVPPMPAWSNWLWLLLALGLVLAMISGVILGAPTLRLRGDYLAIVTLGFGEIVRLTAVNLEDFTVGPRGITQIPHPKIFNYEFGLNPLAYYYLLLALALLMAGVVARLNHSKIGRAWAAIREDEVAAATSGVPVVRMKLWAFAIGASTAGVAGVVQASRVTYVSPETFTLQISIFVLVMVVLGGMGSIAGSVVGAAVIVAVPELLRSQFPAFSEYRFLAFGALLVLMMIFRPQGLIPSQRRKRELKEVTQDAVA